MKLDVPEFNDSFRLTTIGIGIVVVVCRSKRGQICSVRIIVDVGFDAEQFGQVGHVNIGLE